MSDIKLGFLLSFSYFSYIPIKIKEYRESKSITKYTVSFIPFVGFSLGLLSIGLYFLLATIFVPLYASIISAIFYMASYGFLHLEAICDVVDGYFASLSQKDIHKVMKEPTVGAMGIIAITFFLIFKVSAIVYLFSEDKIFLLLVALTLSRLIIFYILHFFEFHPSSGMAKHLKSAIDFKFLIIISIFYFILLLFFVTIIKLLTIFVLATIFAFIVTNHLRSRLGFINGDVLGFNIELVELFVINLLLV
jgi:adenosylcobinamide-GDP ribazoletransferase